GGALPVGSGARSHLGRGARAGGLAGGPARGGARLPRRGGAPGAGAAHRLPRRAVHRPGLAVPHPPPCTAGGRGQRRRLPPAGPLRRGACRAGLTGDRVEPAPIVPQVIHAMTFVHVGSFFGPTDESLRIYRWGESSGALELVGASTDGVENPLYLATD